MLMSKKIQYMREVPPHGNVVKFIGEVDENSSEGWTSFIFSRLFFPLPRFSLRWVLSQ